jgi:uncharacterized protein (DUF2141 family)
MTAVIARLRAALAATATLPLLISAAPPAPSLEIGVMGLRNDHGMIQACLTRDRQHFPDCKRDPNAMTTTAPATAAAIRFAGFAPGTYAVTMFHDENGNRKLDKTIGIPREGFGFSRNPVIRFGAPRFTQVEMDLAGGTSHRTIRMRYLF